jgi:hypothetical protein
MSKKILISILMILLSGLIIYYFFPESNFPTNIKIDKLIVYKSQRELCLMSDNNIIKKYSISLGGNPIGENKNQEIIKPRKEHL